MRPAIFKSIHRDDWDQYLRKALSYLDVEDQQTSRGFGSGIPDGQRCFAAIEAGTSSEGCFQSLESFFEMKSIDAAQLVNIE